MLLPGLEAPTQNYKKRMRAHSALSLKATTKRPVQKHTGTRDCSRGEGTLNIENIWSCLERDSSPRNAKTLAGNKEIFRLCKRTVSVLRQGAREYMP